MQTGRILLIAALAFGGIYYYETSQTEQQKQEYYNQLERDSIAREYAKGEQEQREEKAKLQREIDQMKRDEEESNRRVAYDYQRCFGRPIPSSWWGGNPSEKLKILFTVYPGNLTDERAVCDR
jgi:hypothetical protein